MPGSKEVGTLIQLVGSSPLPNYLSAMTLRPDKIVMVYTDETKQIMERLSMQYRIQRLDTDSIWLEDARDPVACRHVIDDALGKAHLNYTGGTKTMTLNIYQAWATKGGSLRNALYVDDFRGVLRFGDGSEVPINVSLKLDVLAKLHGLSISECTYGKEIQNNKTEIQNHMHKIIKKLKSGESCESSDGSYFERWIALKLMETKLVFLEDVYVGVKFKRANYSRFEIDVAAIRGFRVYLLSSTLVKDWNICRFKAFEVYLRGRQMAGDHIRSGLVAPLDVREVQYIVKDRIIREMLDQPSNLESLVKDHWNNPIQFKVFGLPEILDWGEGLINNPLRSLRMWLQT